MGAVYVIDKKVFIAVALSLILLSGSTLPLFSESVEQLVERSDSSDVEFDEGSIAPLTLLTDETGTFSNGERKTTFTYVQGYDLRFYVENTKGAAFDWTLTDGDKRIIRSGKVAAGKSYLETISSLEDEHTLRSGIYTVSMISIDGTNSNYKISASALN